MARLIAIGVILLSILVLSFTGIWYAAQTQEAMNQKIDQAIELSIRQNQSDLLAITEELQKIWKSRETLLSFYVRHDEIEKMNTDLVSLRSYAETAAFDSAYSVLCQMKFLSNHIYEREIPNLDNLL